MILVLLGKGISANFRFCSVFILFSGLFFINAQAQTDCTNGNGVLDSAPPKDMTPEQLIEKFVANETKVKAARAQYTYTQDMLVQTMDGKIADGQFHQITAVSYDDKGKRQEKVTFAEQSTLRNIQLTPEDFDDVRFVMPWILSNDEAPGYTVTYTGQQHVDDLDTFVFHVVPKKEEKNKRYFEGKLWVDERDLEIVKLCGKGVGLAAKPKKNQSENVRPTFATYRQIVDGYWFPAYVRVDDTLQFGTQSVHVREIVKFKDYKRTGAASTAAKP